MNPKLVSFKAVRGRLTITLGKGKWQDLVQELATQLQDLTTRNFFRGARVMLETGDRAITIDQLEKLITMLSQQGITLVPQDGGKEIAVSPRQASTPLSPPNTQDQTLHSSVYEEKAKLISGTVHSGQRIESDSSIVVMGNVNPGAELITAGEVIVWGILRGRVNAGVPDNNDAFVLALVLEPEHLRIGRYDAGSVDRREYRSRKNWMSGE